MLLESACNDLGRRGAAGIDEDYDRKALRHIARLGIVTLDVRRLTPALRDDLAALEEDVGKAEDRKSTRLNSSHANISYAVFCLKKKKKLCSPLTPPTRH